ncbi:RmlC-like cupin [Exidia glandulosa HHB12029]|uniref:RmlC-like cupin n=1 Tax=Exidia glandulosa HHB12029 TaxID=1314781 RepID=A0A165DDT0_EXIGL|nr:RmlC-like cupin [Exidia glandulosa HHB12029]
MRTKALLPGICLLNSSLNHPPPLAFSQCLSTMASSKPTVLPLRNEQRNNEELSWLQAFQTWLPHRQPSLPSSLRAYGTLQILNEDRIKAGGGFPLHPHRDFEIFTYLVSGELEHRDSMGNVEIIKRGEIQLTSAGTGIRHSEMGHEDKVQHHFCHFLLVLKASQPVHMIQIWTLPNRRSLAPKYFTRTFKDEDKIDKLLLVVAPIGTKDVVNDRFGSGPAPVNSPVELRATLLSPGKTVSHPLPPSPRRCYIHFIQSSGYHPGRATAGFVHVNGETELHEGDGAFVWGDGTELVLENTGDIRAEILVFDVE